jgi:hypothetical protein
VLLAVLVGLVGLLDNVDVERIDELFDLGLRRVEDEDEVEHGHGAALLFIGVVLLNIRLVLGHLHRLPGGGVRLLV